jgi:amino acid transporter
LAFYAFIGFEDMVNVAEEVKNPRRNLPLAIILALCVSTVLYMLVALTAVLALPIETLSQSTAPLATVIEYHNQGSPVSIGLISLVAVINGALIQIIIKASTQMIGRFTAQLSTVLIPSWKPGGSLHASKVNLS